MSKVSDYIEASVGFDSNGLPASSTQFAFGFAPFSIADTENLADVTTISTVCKSDAVVNIKIVDEVAMVEFDFSNEDQVITEMFEELALYKQQRDHVTDSLNDFMAKLAIAERNNDEEEIETINGQIRSMSIPFMIPTIMPVAFGGTVQISFADDPKFIFYTSDQLNQMPYKITMIFDAHHLFCQDEVAIYFEDTEEEIRAQQEELWYLDEIRKAEEEAYFGQYSTYGGGGYYNEDDYESHSEDNRMKGIRFK